MSSDLNNITSTLDTTDLQLLAALQADASISNIALADKLHLSAATCLRRTKRLLQEGWIEKQVAILSSDKLGQLMGPQRHGIDRSQPGQTRRRVAAGL
jgi:Lrp/AsnC family transcriptional regulator, leucine-responsive regulatory protein